MASTVTLPRILLISLLAVAGNFAAADQSKSQDDSRYTSADKQRTASTVGDRDHFLGESLSKGEAAYQRACGICHDRSADHSAARGAPRLGNVAAWESRRKYSVTQLAKTVMSPNAGKTRMPTGDLTLEEVQAAIAYMLKHAMPLF